MRWICRFSDPVASPLITVLRVMSALRPSISASSWLTRSTLAWMRLSTSSCRLLTWVEMRPDSVRKSLIWLTAVPRRTVELGSSTAAEKAE